MCIHASVHALVCWGKVVCFITFIIFTFQSLHMCVCVCVYLCLCAYVCVCVRLLIHVCVCLSE